MQIKFYEIQSFKRHSWISFTFSVALDGVNEIETAVILHHLTSGRWQQFAGWDMVSQYCIMLTAKKTSGEKHFDVVSFWERYWVICEMILNLWVRHKWFLAIFTGHFPVCAPLLMYFTRCIQFNTILFLLVYTSEKHFLFFFFNFPGPNTTLASLGMSNTLVFLKLKLSNTSQTTFILRVLINLYNIQPPKGLSSPS